MTDRGVKIANVLETYFSEANLLWDKVLSSLIQKDKNGFVSLEALSKLTKFKQLNATPEEIKQAAETHCLEKLNIKEVKIARIKPFVANKTEELDEWSIYVEGLSQKYKDEQKIVNLFQERVGHVSFLRIPETRTQAFAGFCFVEFGTREHVQKAIDVFNQDDKLNLRVMAKLEWLKYKDEYLEHMKKKKEEIKEIWNKEKPVESMDVDNEQELELEPASKKPKIKDTRQKEKEEETKEYTPGVIVFVQKVHPDAPKTTIMKLLEKSGVKIVFMKPKRKGVDSVHIRLETPEDAIKLHDYFEIHHVVQENAKDGEGNAVDQPSFETIKTRIIKGKEEEIYWEEDMKRK